MKGRAVRKAALAVAMPDGPSTSIRDAVVALKRERIVTAAVDLFYERGYESTTLEAVAERLGITKPFIYSYFKSKTDLLAEICSRGIASSLAAIKAVLATGHSPTEKLHALGREFVLAVLESQKHVAIFTREEKNLEPQDLARIEQMRREFDRRLVGLLEEGVAAGEFEIDDARIAALAIGGMVSWAYVWYRPAGRLTLAEVADELTRLIVGLVRCRLAATQPETEQVLRHGNLALKPRVNRAYWDYVDVELSLTEFKTVSLLVANAGTYVTYRQIYDSMHYVGFVVGSGEGGYRTNVRSSIKRIRGKFKLFDPSFDEIANYKGFGYCWGKSGQEVSKKALD